MAERLLRNRARYAAIQAGAESVLMLDVLQGGSHARTLLLAVDPTLTRGEVRDLLDAALDARFPPPARNPVVDAQRPPGLDDAPYDDADGGAG